MSVVSPKPGPLVRQEFALGLQGQAVFLALKIEGRGVELIQKLIPALGGHEMRTAGTHGCKSSATVRGVERVKFLLSNHVFGYVQA